MSGPVALLLPVDLIKGVQHAVDTTVSMAVRSVGLAVIRRVSPSVSDDPHSVPSQAVRLVASTATAAVAHIWREVLKAVSVEGVRRGRTAWNAGETGDRSTGPAPREARVRAGKSVYGTGVTDAVGRVTLGCPMAEGLRRGARWCGDLSMSTPKTLAPVRCRHNEEDHAQFG
ncbi:hypothetical protein GCM10010446_04260 [Streptomyces enissocaesilis]|uniref:Uncharacterized protein n=1 Tax=Streptomyces enissocaesilis TaxID=332589 RepID=A0ABP6J7H6_9ACTN